MDSIQLYNQFVLMEREMMLFEQQIDGIYWWDLIRYELFNLIKNKKMGIDSNKNTLINNKYLFSMFINDTFYWLKKNFQKYDYLFMVNSKEKDKNNYFYDINMSPLINVTKNEKNKTYTIIETNSCNNYLGSDGLYNIYLKIFKKAWAMVRHYNIDIDLNKMIDKYFSVKLEANEFLIKKIAEFKVEYKFYLNFLKRHQIRKIFVNQNGVQKALFKAANQLNVDTFEVQHGHTNKYHLLYQYPKELGEKIIVPKIFLTYADYWGYQCSQVMNMIIGKKNTPYFESDIRRGIAIIVSPSSMEKLMKFTLELREYMPTDTIIFKLHPNQVEEKSKVKRYFAAYKNIQVICEEENISQVLNKVKMVLLVHSTCIYEALQTQKEVFVYKIDDYNMYNELFHRENIYLVNSVEEMKRYLENNPHRVENYKVEKCEFFSPVNYKKINEILEVEE